MGPGGQEDGGARSRLCRSASSPRSPRARRLIASACNCRPVTGDAFHPGDQEVRAVASPGLPEGVMARAVIADSPPWSWSRGRRAGSGLRVPEPAGTVTRDPGHVAAQSHGLRWRGGHAPGDQTQACPSAAVPSTAVVGQPRPVCLADHQQCASKSSAGASVETSADRSLAQLVVSLKARASHGVCGDRDAPSNASAQKLGAAAQHRCDDGSGRRRRLKLADASLGRGEQGRRLFLLRNRLRSSFVLRYDGAVSGRSQALG